MEHENPPDEDDDFTHSVTYPGTVKHWVLYTMDAIEAEHAPESTPHDADEDGGINTAREDGVLPEDIYEYAAGDDSIVFKNHYEISTALSEMARSGDAGFGNRPVDRRTNATDWGGPDVKYRYRLSSYGRNVLLDLGVPEQLPNREDYDSEDRELDVEPAHQPGWWQADSEYEHFTDEFDIRDHDWLPSDHNRIFFKNESAEALSNNRGYYAMAEDLADAFPDVTFVLTVGPYRMHDLAYVIRDPWRKVVQIDVYSPMAMTRSPDEIKRNFEGMVRDIHRGLESVTADEVTHDE